MFAHLNKNKDDFDIRDETIHEFDFNQPSLRKRGYSEKIINYSESEFGSNKFCKKSKTGLAKADTFNKKNTPSIIFERGSEEFKSSLDDGDDNNDDFDMMEDPIVLPPNKEEQPKPKHSSFKKRSLEEKRIEEQKEKINMLGDPYIMEEDDDPDLFFPSDFKRFKSNTKREKTSIDDLLDDSEGKSSECIPHIQNEAMEKEFGQNSDDYKINFYSHQSRQ